MSTAHVWLIEEAPPGTRAWEASVKCCWTLDAVRAVAGSRAEARRSLSFWRTEYPHLQYRIAKYVRVKR
jgi:hypothetical protein